MRGVIDFDAVIIFKNPDRIFKIDPVLFNVRCVFLLIPLKKQTPSPLSLFFHYTREGYVCNRKMQRKYQGNTAVPTGRRLSFLHKIRLDLLCILPI